MKGHGMLGIDGKRWRMRAALGWTLTGVLLLGCAEREGTPEGERLGDRRMRIELVERYEFVGEVLENEDLSGLAFASDRYGLLGADEARAVQVVELAREAKRLKIVRTIPLLDSGEEIDVEGVAAGPEAYYVTGSHGISKKRGEHQENRFRIFRLRADPATGLPIEGGSADMSSLTGILQADPTLGEHFGRPLQQRGINIEGLAARDGRLFVGFRSPNLDGDAFVMEVAADEVFEAGPEPEYTLHRLHVGEGLGIREIVAAREGFLLIAGNAGSEPSATFTAAQDYDEDRDFFLYRWDGAGRDVVRIGPIPDPPGKAEAMALLEETPDYVLVLILFDGPARGRPSVYRIS